MQQSRLLTLIGAMLSLATPALAESIPDTLLIRNYRATAPQSHAEPFFSDSIDINGKEYNSMSQLELLPQLGLKDTSLTSTTTSDSAGHLRLSSGAQETMHTLYTSLVSRSFEKGDLLVECPVPYILYLDGREIARSTTYQEEGTAEPRKLPIQLLPSSHHPITLRAMTKPGEDATVRLRVALARSGAEVENRADAREYVSLRYMQTGKGISSVKVSPSGRFTTLTIQEWHNDNREYQTYLYEGSTLRSILPQEFRFASWMPRSEKLYTTRMTDEGRQLITYDPSSLTIEVLVKSMPAEVNFVISPTEEQLILLPKVKGPDKGKNATQALGRYDRLAGFRDRTFIGLLDIKTGEQSRLTFGHRGTSLHDISADGKELIFSSSRETTEIPFSESDILTLRLSDLKVDTLFAANSDINAVNYTSNPSLLLIEGTANAFDGIGRNLPDTMEVNTYDQQLFLYNRTTKAVTPLTKEFDPAVTRVQVLAEREGAYFTAENEDRVSLYYCDFKSGAITQVKVSEDLVRSFSVDNTGKRLAYAGQSIMNSDRSYLIDLQRGAETMLQDVATSKMADLMLGTAEDWDFTMPNGDRVQGRYYLPPNFDPQKKYPMIVYYYGGTSPTPRSFEGSYSLPMYAAQGYVVYTLNPSGSTGFGQEYASRHINAWGIRTADEIIASVAGFCEAHPFVNKERIGCIGASYGGFMTQYLQTVTDLFAAAVSHAGISALSSYWGEGYWGVGYSAVASLGSYPWNNPKLYTEQSPLFRADKINTPLLLLHGDADTNVPYGESVQMYNALKILGKEVEFVTIHGEDHGIVNPERKRTWTYTTFAWFQRWLKDDPTWWDTLYPQPNL
ncbi:MAG: prolyl oligopeptidase family serine peptidase [Porphyromonas sp.]|nr:prolyl oligopeptidase family serine peptidase [Porphyromonas sp.]